MLAELTDGSGRPETPSKERTQPAPQGHTSDEGSETCKGTVVSPQ